MTTMLNVKLRIFTYQGLNLDLLYMWIAALHVHAMIDQQHNAIPILYHQGKMPIYPLAGLHAFIIQHSQETVA